MIKLIFTVSFLFVLTACASLGQHAEIRKTPPTAVEALRIFFENGNYPTRGATNCYVAGSFEPDPYAPTIGAYIASRIGEETRLYGKDFKNNPDENKIAVYSDCNPELVMIEQEDGSLIPAWGCSVYFIDGMKGNPFISSSGVSFGIKQDLSGIVKGSVSCSP